MRGKKKEEQTCRCSEGRSRSRGTRKDQGDQGVDLGLVMGKVLKLFFSLVARAL